MEIPTQSSSEDPSTRRCLRITTRSSALAIAQTNLFIQLLATHPSPSISAISTSIHPIHTSLGDTDKSTDLHTLANSTGGKSLWTEDLEEELVAGRMDVIVHSLKDVPTRLRKGVVVSAVGGREGQLDCVVLPSPGRGRAAEGKEGKDAGPSTRATEDSSKSTATKQTGTGSAAHEPTILSTLSAGSIVGTSSIRRAAMLKRRYPDLHVVSCRGNVNTRLRKLDNSSSVSAPSSSSLSASTSPPPNLPSAALEVPESSHTGSESAPTKQAQHYDALILASAGLQRMNLSTRISATLSRENDGFMHSVGQGALGVEWRTDDEWVTKIIHALLDQYHDDSLPSSTKTGTTAVAETDSGVERRTPSRKSGWRVRWECAAERSLLRVLEGGCSVPVGVESTWSDLPSSSTGISSSSPSLSSSKEETAEPHSSSRASEHQSRKGEIGFLTLHAMVVSPDGQSCVQASGQRDVDGDEAAEELGKEVAGRLVEGGAGEILKAIERHGGGPS